MSISFVDFIITGDNDDDEDDECGGGGVDVVAAVTVVGDGDGDDDCLSESGDGMILLLSVDFPKRNMSLFEFEDDIIFVSV